MPKTRTLQIRFNLKQTRYQIIAKANPSCFQYSKRALDNCTIH